MEIRSCIRKFCSKERHRCRFGFTLSKRVDYWVGVSSGVGWDSSNNLVVWVSSNSGGVWIVSVGGSSIWVAGSISVVEDSWVSFRVSFTLGDDMSGNWVVNVWESSVGGVWGYVVDVLPF